MVSCVVTGGGGFLGSRFSRYLGSLGNDVFTVGLKKCDYEIDLTDRCATERVINDLSPAYVFHFAGSAYTDDWKILFSGNVETTMSVLDAVNPECRTVIIGSASEYGRVYDLPIKESCPLQPVSLYGLSMKMRSEIAGFYSRRGKDVMVARVFNPIGKGVSSASPIGSFLMQINDRQIKAGNLEVKRDFIDISDLNKAVWMIAQHGKSGEAYNVCSGKSYRLGDILQKMIMRSRKKVKINSDKIRFRKDDIPEVYGSIEKIRKDTKWEPVVCINDSVKNLF